MTILKLKYTVPLLLITLAAVGGVKAFYQIVENRILEDAGSVAVVPAPGPERKSPAAPAPALVPKRSDISMITSRNLFASREVAPPAAQDIQIEDPRPSSLAVVLMGTITGTDGVERAIIYDKAERKQELYQKGDFLQQAAIKQIMRGKVILSLDGKDEILDIADARSVKVPQYKSAVTPRTTSKRVVGRPVPAGSEPLQDSREADEEDAAGASNTVRTSKKPVGVLSNNGNVIVKGRASNQPAEESN